MGEIDSNWDSEHKLAELMGILHPILVNEISINRSYSSIQESAIIFAEHFRIYKLRTFSWQGLGTRGTADLRTLKLEVKFLDK